MDTHTHVVTATATGAASSAAARLVADLRRDLAGEEPALVMVFASTAQPLADVRGPLGCCELGGVPIAGFVTYGEIALGAGDMSGFHDTTSVVLAFPR